MKHTSSFLFLVAFSLLSSCARASTGETISSNESSTGTITTSTSGTSSSTSTPLPPPSSGSSSVAASEPTYEDFWLSSSDLSISLTFTNASLYALSDYGYNYDEKYADLYFPASFKATLAGKTYTYDEVGVRMKGNTSRAMICSSNGTISDVCHFKVSFKCTFDDDLYSQSAFSAFKHTWSDSAARKERKARRFASMSKLDLKYLPRNDSNSSSYATYSQEMYCFHVFEQEGIVAPKAKWASLTFKDDKASKTSSYEAIEAVDEDFISHHFSAEETGGDLYKCSTYKSGSSYIKADLTTSGALTSAGTRVSSGKIGVEDCYNLYHPNYQLKTNDDGENSDFSKMVNFITTVNSVKTGKSSQKSLENALDVQEFLTFEGVSYTLGNFDDQRNNYNNYFIYFRANDGKAVYIPYDWDWAFGGSVMSSSQSTLKPYHTSTTHDSSNTNPLYWCTILSNSSLQYALTDYRSTYASAIKKVVSDGFLNSGTYSSFVSSLAGSTLKELSQVSSYMESKKSVISSSL
jgi:spore coat protein CotH